MRRCHTFYRYLGVLLLPVLLVPAWSQDASANPQARGDNTKVNQRDRNAAEPTADQQKENQSDRDLTKQVRRSLVDDKSLSTYAHNVKVIAQNGKVTLKGPVRSEEEKAAVLSKAAEVAGKDNITDEITIVPKTD
jgi:hyperosmotically inducible periplasmic protein